MKKRSEKKARKAGDQLKAVPLNEIEKYTTCTLCNHTIVQATTIIECLHSFCRACITTDASQPDSSCPTCGIHLGAHPESLFKSDPTLQSIITKLVPAGLHQRSSSISGLHQRSSSMAGTVKRKTANLKVLPMLPKKKVKVDDYDSSVVEK